MPYNEKDDKVLKEVGSIQLGEKARLVVQVVSYAGGEPKIRIAKVGGKWISTKVGRISPEVAEALADLLIDAALHVRKAA